ncbi:hypothetical protein [Chitinophaga vietnamensis]|uniref:hypothetical protein n=1 Tax=Chitinophaga vietnamensis TaxID=2593957 RepID=UPI0011783798|nr:hypothetical protein [Chitinophaga vietnamensis]
MPEDLKAIYQRLYDVLQQYVPPLNPKVEGMGRYDLYAMHEVTLQGRSYPELFFAGLGARKGYTGLYFFPVYTHPEEFKAVSPALKKCLKGKSCFHIKTLNNGLLEDINAMLAAGFAFYKDKGLIK